MNNKGTQPLQQTDALKALCANISQGLHAVAQPLAILRASLGIDRASSMSLEELRELATGSAREVERVCALFSCMQQLVSTESSKPRLVATPILPVLTNTADGIELLFEEDGMGFRLQLPEACPDVLMDSTRTVRALSSVLLIAHKISRIGETVELIAAETGGVIHVAVQNLSSSGRTMDAESKLNMVLAEANMRSQQVELCWSLTPFSVQMDFEKAISVPYC